MNNKIIFEGKTRERLHFHELSAFALLLEHFDTDIVCINPGDKRTPDLRVGKIEWELKSPRGSGPDTIEKILKKAARQFANVILDLSRIKMNNDQAISRTRHYLKNNRHYIDRLLIITKERRIIDLTHEL